MTLSANFAISGGSCVTITTVLPSLFKSINMLRISKPVFESRFPVGSSARRIEGSLMSALAIETLCD